MMTAIFVLSAQPGDTLPLPDLWNFDKVLHLLAYAVLASTCLFALHPVPAHAKTAVALGVLCLTALYGVTDEFHQSFVPNRTPSLADVVADTLGGAIIAGLWWWQWRSKSSPAKPELVP